MRNRACAVSSRVRKERAKQADQDGDGELSFDDFYHFIQSKGMI